jgi:hypothetical protein
MRLEDMTIELNLRGRTLADRRDPDGGFTCLREAREHYARGERKHGDAAVLLIELRAMELGDMEMAATARAAAREGDHLR